jgi:2-amino-4-hydroxy-6-hydroxymethyldihydropteridine diphosphokinase
MSERAAIALGSNIEDPEAQVTRAFDEISALPETRLIKRSRLHRTKPVGYADQPDFVNAAVLIETRLAPRALLDALLEIEKRHGRVREIPNGPRTLDLDIILYGGATIEEPHPRAHERAFVLEPLREVWPEAVIPAKAGIDAVIPAQAGVDTVIPAKAGIQLDPGLRRDDGLRDDDLRRDDDGR